MDLKIAVILFASLTFVSSQLDDPDRWWRSANIYQISVVSFKDSDNDGYGDIQGIISKLDYIVDTGFDVIFLTPFFKTPFKDFAYDISNYTEVDPRFGTMSDAEELFQKAREKGLKVILDFVPNHSSDEHEWFINSENNVQGYEHFYIWHEGVPTVNGGRPLPPNGWQSVYGGSSWEWSDKRQAYYYHAFAKEQPDLNLSEQRLIDELDQILLFWLEKGADGFRIDAVSQLYEDPAFLADPEISNNLPQTYSLVAKWRSLVDNYTMTKGGDNKILIPQVWESNLDALAKYIQDNNGNQLTELPTNFILINELNTFSRALAFDTTIKKYLSALPTGARPNWFLGTHDHSRVASRMEPARAEGLMMLLLTLPGVAFTYNGDEIGMMDYRDISWDDTTDPWACNNIDDYKKLSRDPQRTPFQWDNSTNAGFNAGAKPWNLVHPNYTQNNLEMQMNAASSHYKFYKELLKLRKTSLTFEGYFHSQRVTNNVFGYARPIGNGSEALLFLINLGSSAFTINLGDPSYSDIHYFGKLQNETYVHLASPSSSHNAGDFLWNNTITLGPFDAVIVKSDATRTTSVLAIVVLIVKLFL